MSFDGDQRGYFLREINRALPVSGSGAIPSDDTIALALGNVDPMMPGAAGAPATTEARQFLSYYGAGTAAYAADAACRQITNPLQMRGDPAARTGCGWYFRKGGSVASTAAHGTRRGPMSPTLDAAGAGQWIWDPMEAALAESHKQAAKIQSCPQIQYSPFPNMGWCPSTNSALATDGFGNPLFPRARGGDCPGGGIITNASQCPPPGGAAAAGGGGGGAAGSGSDPCASTINGAYSAPCLSQLAQQVGISANSALIQAVNSGDWSTVNALTAIAGANSTWNTSDKNLWQTACQNIANIANTKPGRAGGAAGAIAYGTAFDVCALQPTDTSPFSAECVTAAALSKGFSPKGLAMPAQWGMDFWNNLPNYGGQTWGDNTWQSVLNQMDDMLKYANTPGYGTPAQQQTAIAQVYGTQIQYPKTDCNNSGILLYRYYFPPVWDFSLMPTWGPQTHFLGRYIFKQAVPSTSGDPAPGVTPSAIPNAPPGSYKDMAPSGGNLTEAHRLECNFTVTSGDWHVFAVQVDDLCQMYIDDNPTPYLTASCCGNWTAGPPITNWQINETHKLTWLYVNGGGPWSFGCQLALQSPITNQGEVNLQFGPIPATQTFMTQDRRKPTLGLEFAKTRLASPSGADFADTNNVLTNWAAEGSSQVSQAYGQLCLAVSPSSGLYNYKTYNQGIGSHALRSMTCRLYVDSVTPGTWPSVWEFFNLGGSQPLASPRKGPPQGSFAWNNRTDAMGLVINSNGLVCHGIMSQSNNIPWQTTKLNVGLPMKQWCHVAVVWDDDWKGFALYVNAQLADRYRMATPLPNFLMEQICIGSVDNGDGSGWIGGIAWWRGFDYRLSTDQITLDMNDAWDTLY